MTPKKWLHLAAMIVLGAVTFVAFGWLVEYRQGQPLDPPPGTDTAIAIADPATVLVRGLAAVAEKGSDALSESDRGRAMAALDASLHLTEVGRDAVDGRRQWAFAAAYLEVQRARTAIQVGSIGGTETNLGRVVNTMETALDTPGRAALPEQSDWGAYDGATVLNAMGVRVGDVDHLEQGDGGPRAVLVIGRAVDVYGIFRLGRHDGDRPGRPAPLPGPAARGCPPRRRTHLRHQRRGRGRIGPAGLTAAQVEGRSVTRGRSRRRSRRCGGPGPPTRGATPPRSPPRPEPSVAGGRSPVRAR